jgi:hypothetical protein
MTMLDAIPGGMESAATQLGATVAGIAGANAAAAAPTNSVLPPGDDEVSALLSMMFNTHGALHQAMQGLGTAIGVDHVATLGTSAVSYDATEAANAFILP